MVYYYCYVPLWYEPGLTEISHPKRLYPSIQAVYDAANEIVEDERTIHDPQIVKIELPDNITVIPTQITLGVFRIVEATPLDWQKIQRLGKKKSTNPATLTLFKSATSMQERSQLSEQFFDGHHDVSIQNKKFRSHYQIVNRYLADFDQPLVSMGSDPKREICLLNPTSETMTKLVSDLMFKIQISAAKSPLARIEMLMHFVRHHLLHSSGMEQNVARLNKMNESWLTEHADDPDAYLLRTNEKGSHKISVIPIDHFIKQKFGTCRHITLLTAFLLYKLIKEDFLDGSVYHHRDNIIGGAHSWVIYKDPSNQVYVVDATLSNKPYNLADSAFKPICLPLYGIQAFTHMEERYLDRMDVEQNIEYKDNTVNVRCI